MGEPLSVRCNVKLELVDDDDRPERHTVMATVDVADGHTRITSDFFHSRSLGDGTDFSLEAGVSAASATLRMRRQWRALQSEPQRFSNRLMVAALNGCEDDLKARGETTHARVAAQARAHRARGYPAAEPNKPQ